MLWVIASILRGWILIYKTDPRRPFVQKKTVPKSQIHKETLVMQPMSCKSCKIFQEQSGQLLFYCPH